jgi:hypothetical protein
VPLYDRSDDRLYYAPWRDDPRPLGGLLQGAYAFLGVADFWRVQRSIVDSRQRTYAHFEFARWRERVARVLDVLTDSGGFLPAGLRFLDAMRTSVDGWRTERVPPDAAALAREAADDHRVGWRLRNLRPDRDHTDARAREWLAGDRPAAADPPRVETLAQQRAFVPNPRLDLACLRMTDPDRFAGFAADPAGLRRAVPAASAGDIAQASGDFTGALAAYRRQIDADPDTATQDWAGLILAAGRLAPADELGPLLSQPEIVYWLHRHVRAAGGPPPDPLALAGWLATAPGRAGGG